MLFALQRNTIFCAWSLYSKNVHLRRWFFSSAPSHLMWCRSIHVYILTWSMDFSGSPGRFTWYRLLVWFFYAITWFFDSSDSTWLNEIPRSGDFQVLNPQKKVALDVAHHHFQNESTWTQKIIPRGFRRFIPHIRWTSSIWDGFGSVFKGWKCESRGNMCIYIYV